MPQKSPSGGIVHELCHDVIDYRILKRYSSNKGLDISSYKRYGELDESNTALRAVLERYRTHLIALLEYK